MYHLGQNGAIRLHIYIYSNYSIQSTLKLYYIWNEKYKVPLSLPSKCGLVATRRPGCGIRKHPILLKHDRMCFRICCNSGCCLSDICNRNITAEFTMGFSSLTLKMFSSAVYISNFNDFCKVSFKILNHIKPHHLWIHSHCKSWKNVDIHCLTSWKYMLQFILSLLGRSCQNNKNKLNNKNMCNLINREYFINTYLISLQIRVIFTNSAELQK